MSDIRIIQAHSKTYRLRIITFFAKGQLLPLCKPVSPAHERHSTYCYIALTDAIIHLKCRDLSFILIFDGPKCDSDDNPAVMNFIAFNGNPELSCVLVVDLSQRI